MFMGTASIFVKPKRLSENNDQELSRLDIIGAYKVQFTHAPIYRQLRQIFSPGIHYIPQNTHASHTAKTNTND